MAINEWLGCRILQHLGISTPETALVHVDEALARLLPFGTAGCHFGSKYPSDNFTAYDLLPDSFLGKIINTGDFVGVLAADKWLGHTDSRQCIFVRERSVPPRKEFIALMIDQKHIFNSACWEYVDAPASALYWRRQVYSGVSMDHFEPWLDRVSAFSETALASIVGEMPSCWLGSDIGPLEDLLESLMTHRRRRLPDLLLNCYWQLQP